MRVGEVWMNGFSASTAGTLLTILESTAVNAAVPGSRGRAPAPCDPVGRQQRPFRRQRRRRTGRRTGSAAGRRFRDRPAAGLIARVTSRNAPPIIAASPRAPGEERDRRARRHAALALTSGPVDVTLARADAAEHGAPERIRAARRRRTTTTTSTRPKAPTGASAAAKAR